MERHSGGGTEDSSVCMRGLHWVVGAGAPEIPSWATLDVREEGTGSSWLLKCHDPIFSIVHRNASSTGLGWLVGYFLWHTALHQVDDKMDVPGIKLVPGQRPPPCAWLPDHCQTPRELQPDAP